MSQAANDLSKNVVPLHRPIPMTEAERSARYRARQRLKKVKRGSPKGVTKRVTRDGQKLVTQTVTPAVTESVTTPVTDRITPSVTAPVDLIALRRSIQDWTKLHNEVERLRTGREPYNPRMWFLAVAVAFFVLVAYSAAVPA